MVYTNVKDIYDDVVQAYREDDVEFSSAFLEDIEVDNINGNELLELYRDLQKSLNGDEVIRLQAGERLAYYTATDDPADERVAGVILPLETKELDKNYSGNLLGILAGFENGADSKVVRVDHIVETDTDVTGLMILLDYIY